MSYHTNETILITSGVIFCTYVVIRIATYVTKQKDEEPEFESSFLPKGTVFPDEDDVDYESDEDDIDPPFVIKPWYYFITKHFEKPKPPLDKTMLALHISSMSYIHRLRPEQIPQFHVSVDDKLLEDEWGTRL